MKERPIIFNSEMVRAILDGRKTQTRRVVKNPPSYNSRKIIGARFMKPSGRFCKPRWFWETEDKLFLADIPFQCPYGRPRDRLWVREAWRVFSWYEGNPINVEFKDGRVFECKYDDWVDTEDWEERMMIQSAEDCEKAGLKLNEDMMYEWDDIENPCRWRPSIHMPRWASRITLEITDVRVERVQEISSLDLMKKEGIDNLIATHSGVWAQYWTAYNHLWNSINAKRGYGWDVNPWVWVIDFKWINKNEIHS